MEIDKALLEKVDIWNGEKVLVVDNTSGARAKTYVIEEERNSGEIVIYGAASNLIKKGDEIIIMAFKLADNPIKAKKILVDSNNRFVRYL